MSFRQDLAVVLTHLLMTSALVSCDKDKDVAEIGVDGGRGFEPDARLYGPDGSAEDGLSAGGCPAAGTTVPGGFITQDTVWDCPSYTLRSLTYVTNGATLTIKPGVKIAAQVADENAERRDEMHLGGALIVDRGSRLIAKGTPNAPIVFTSAAPPGKRKAGDFGGLALLGSAPLNAGSCESDSSLPRCAPPTYGHFQRALSALPPNEPRARFGGSDPAGSCGELAFVRVEFAGAPLEGQRRLSALTIAGCGSGTKLSFVQVHRSKSSGITSLGGAAAMDHVLVTGDEGNGFEWDGGWEGSVQFLVVHKWPGMGGIGAVGLSGRDSETTSYSAPPTKRPTVSNATFLGTPDHAGFEFLGNVRIWADLRNSVFQGFGLGAGDVVWHNAVVPQEEWPARLSVANSFFWMNGPNPETEPRDNDDSGFDEQAQLRATALGNRFDVDPGLSGATTDSPNYAPTQAALGAQPPPPAGLDETATYSGAFSPGALPWTEGWAAFPVE